MPTPLTTFPLPETTSAEIGAASEAAPSMERALTKPELGDILPSDADLIPAILGVPQALIGYDRGSKAEMTATMVEVMQWRSTVKIEGMIENVQKIKTEMYRNVLDRMIGPSLQGHWLEERNKRVHHAPQKRHKAFAKKLIKRMPRDVFLEKIKVTQLPAKVRGQRQTNLYVVEVFSGALNKKVTVKAQGLTCPIDVLVTKMQIFS